MILKDGSGNLLVTLHEGKAGKQISGILAFASKLQITKAAHLMNGPYFPTTNNCGEGAYQAATSITRQMSPSAGNDSPTRERVIRRRLYASCMPFRSDGRAGGPLKGQKLKCPKSRKNSGHSLNEL